MSERIELIAQRAREEAADRALRWRTARKTTGNFLPIASNQPCNGQTACPRCGVRNGIGCRHQVAGQEPRRVTSQSIRQGVVCSAGETK